MANNVPPKKKALKTAAEKTAVIKKKAAAGSKAAGPDASVRSLSKRVGVLEGHVEALKAFTGIEAEMEPVTFTLQAGGPQIVRLTLDGKEVILLDSGPKDSEPRANGVIVSVFMEVWGNPGDQAVVDVSNAGPSPMSSSVLTSGHGVDVRTLKTKF